MKHAAAWLMTLALVTPNPSNAEDHNMTLDQTNALLAVETMTEAFQNKDIATVMSAYEPGATVVFDPDAPISDAAQLEEMFRNMSMINPVFDYAQGHDVIVRGDIAMHIAPWTMTGVTPDGQTIAQSGLSVAILRRQLDGSWKMVIDNPHGGRLLQMASQ